MCGFEVMCSHLRAGMGPNCAHRGPDGEGMAVAGPYTLYFHQLDVVVPGDGSHGSTQPLQRDGKTLVCNGEIYNEDLWVPRVAGTSDCAVLLDLVGKQSGGMGYSDPGVTCDLLRGEYAFVMVNETTHTLWAGRDEFGVRPMYQAHCSVCHRLCFASEAACFKGPFRCGAAEALDVAQFPPNTLLELPYEPDRSAKRGASVAPVAEAGRPSSAEQVRQRRRSLEPRRHTIHRYSGESLGPTTPWESFLDAVRVRAAVNLGGAVEPQVGILLSGGVDSGAVLLACAQLGLAGRCIAFTQQLTPAPEDSTEDVRLATLLAKELGMSHRVYHDTPRAALEVVPQVVDAIASYDVTTVRASTPAFLLCRHIRQDYPHIRVLLCGEGADELFGGYQYFRQAPTIQLARAESERLRAELHFTDLRRVDGTAGAHGFEVRAPYLDRYFVNHVSGSPTKDDELFDGLDQVEKKWWREVCSAQAAPGSVFADIAWRPKEAFSDGVGHGWVDLLRNGTITGEPLEGGSALVARAARNYRHVPPQTAEALWYRTLFVELYGLSRVDLLPHMWLPAPWAQVVDKHDPSARALSNYRPG